MNKVSILLLTITLISCSKEKKLIQEWPANSTVTFDGNIKEISLTSFHSSGGPADKVNLVVEAKSEEQFVECFVKAGWSSTDKLNALNLSREVTDILRTRPYLAAPISSLYLFGRKQDHGFELEVDGSPRARHHVRFWRSPFEQKGRTLWFGAAVYDENVEWKHLTHRTNAEIDVERDYLLKSLEKSKCVKGYSLVNSKDDKEAKGLETDNQSYYIKF